MAKPVLIMEVGDFGISGSSTSNTMVWLGKKGYRPFECNVAKLVPHQSRDVYLPGDIFYVHSDQLVTRI